MSAGRRFSSTAWPGWICSFHGTRFIEAHALASSTQTRAVQLFRTGRQDVNHRLNIGIYMDRHHRLGGSVDRPVSVRTCMYQLKMLTPSDHAHACSLFCSDSRLL